VSGEGGRYTTAKTSLTLMLRYLFLNTFLFAYPLDILYSSSQLVHEFIPENSGGKEEGRKERY
jgi:hypothetical protein